MVVDFASRRGITGAGSAASLTPEQHLIVAGIRQVLLPNIRTPTDGRSAPIDWDCAVKLIVSEGLAPIVYTSLASLPWSAPRPVQAILQTTYLASQVRSRAWILPAFGHAVEVLGGLGIQPIVLKGMALAHTVYPEPAHRTMSDIDLLLPAGDLARAGDALRETGFWTEGANASTEHHSRPLFWYRGQASVELHRQLFPSPEPLPVTYERLRSRSRLVTVGGVNVHVLGPTDTLLHTCLHLAYHHRYRWFLLRGLMDILAITARYADAFDWDDFLTSALTPLTAGATYWPLKMAHEWLGADIPERAQLALAPSDLVRRVIGAVMEPRAMLGATPAVKNSDIVLGNTVRDLSLYTGCSTAELIRAVLKGIFPPPHAVGHLPASLLGSPLRYTWYLANPIRLSRGLFALWRLLERA
ncbi:MAG TPA: nucleotidyltransferase family protein [Chloroflexota bacterium]|nr:nucleotidyltransferase family protein [Chloroflexota bacterium]